MSAEESLAEGRLDQALSQLQDQVRNDPSNSKYRTFLFQLLALMGQWERALTQRTVRKDMDVRCLPRVQRSSQAIPCELFRREVFRGLKSPLIFGDPDPWVAQLVESLRLGARGDRKESRALQENAFAAAPATPGTLNQEPFEWIADGDTRLGPILEAIIHGRYFWVPFHCIEKIRIEEPADLRDQVWMPAFFTWANQGETVGLIPTRYAGSEDHVDSGIRSARKTEWVEMEGDMFHGLGQKMFATDAGDYALMNIRSVFFETTGKGRDPADMGNVSGGPPADAGPDSGSPAESHDG
ncbi:MAG: type VI secretion system accessory protein TagJ [Planctomycetota bacterium]